MNNAGTVSLDERVGRTSFDGSNEWERKMCTTWQEELIYVGIELLSFLIELVLLPLEILVGHSIEYK